MKSYDETTRDILGKSGRVIRQKRRRRKAAISTFSASTAVVAVVLFVYPYLQTPTESPTGAVSDTATADEAETPVWEADGNEIIINELSEAPSGIDAYYPLWTDNYRFMSREELLAYYGIEEFDLSTVLSGFTESTAESYFIYSDELGYPETYNYHFKWTDETGTKALIIEFAHDEIPLDAIIGPAEALNGELEPSTLEGVEMKICSYFNEENQHILGTAFVTNGIGTSVVAVDLGKDEFLSALVYFISIL